MGLNDAMGRAKESVGFLILMTVGLLALFRHELAAGHYLYPAVIEDPAARLSFLPWDMTSARAFSAGHFPLWNPDSGTGMPLLANLQSSPANPFKWPFFLAPSLRVLDLMVVLRLALAGTLLFLLARALGLSLPAAVLAGGAFSISGYLIKHLNMVNVSSEMWAPLIMFLMVREKERGPRLPGFLVSSLAWALVLGGGNPEAAFYVGLLCLGFLLVLGAGGRPWPTRLVTSFAGPFVLGALLTSAQSLPFVEYLGQGFTIHDSALHTVARHPARLIGSLVAPWLLGPSGSHPDQTLQAPYLGVTILVLALYAMARVRDLPRTALFFMAAAAIGLALVYSAPPLSLLATLPPFDRSGNAKFAMAGVTLSLALLAGFGLDQLAGSRGGRRLRAPALAMVSILLLGGGLEAISRYHQLARTWFLVPFAFLAGTAALMVMAAMAAKREGGAKREGPGLRSRGLAWSLMVMGLLELAINLGGYRIDSALPPAMASFEPDSPPEALALILDDPGHPRFTGISGALHHNFNLLFGAADLRAFDGIYPHRYVRAMARIEGFDMIDAVQNFFSHGWSFDVSPANLGHPLVSKMGVKYVVSATPLDAPGLLPLKSGTYLVYENPLAFARAWTVSGAAEPGPAAVASYARERVELTAKGPARLVLADTFFPGWRAEVDGKEQVIEAEDDLFRAVELGPGGHSVIMTYQPWSFRVGLWMSLAALLSLAGAAALKATMKESIR